MIEHHAETGSHDWKDARFGIPTASQFSRILTPSGRPSAQQTKYIGELCAEWALGEGADESLVVEGSQWIDRGNRLEARARQYADLICDDTFRKCGLIYRDDARDVAATPDGIGSTGVPLELKCPMPKNHLVWLVGGAVPRPHVMQVQGQIWVCGSEGAVFASYCPNLPGLVVDVEPLPEIQEALDREVPKFLKRLSEAKAILREQGVDPYVDYVEGRLGT